MIDGLGCPSRTSLFNLLNSMVSMFSMFSMVSMGINGVLFRSVNVDGDVDVVRSALIGGNGWGGYLVSSDEYEDGGYG